MIRGKGEALSPAKINRDVWSNPAVQVKGLFTVSAALLLLGGLAYAVQRETGGAGGNGREGERKEKQRELKGEGAENRDVKYRNMGEKPTTGPLT